MRIFVACMTLALALSWNASCAWSATVAIGASKDNSIYQNFGANSGGGSAGIYVGTTSNTSPRRGLIAFDIAGNVPAGSTITSAQLTLYLALAGGGSDQTIALHRLSTDWGEGTAGGDTETVHFSGMGFAANPGDATWNERFFGSTAWSNPGGTGDFNPTASASAVIGIPDSDPSVIMPYNWLSTAALVGDVQNWLNNPATNFGWMLINANESSPGTVRAFFSRSATVNIGGDPLTIDPYPVLTITFTAVPEPAAAVLLAMAGLLGFIAGRRR
jgi:MprA protease rhombosortase-interaction domain-containing protein